MSLFQSPVVDNAATATSNDLRHVGTMTYTAKYNAVGHIAIIQWKNTYVFVVLIATNFATDMGLQDAF